MPKEIKQFMEEFWQLIKKYYKPESTDEYWNGLLTEEDRLVKRYNNHRFVMCVLCALTNYLEGKQNETTL